jgi:hypothetical protein
MTLQVGYTLSSEQFGPQELVDFAVAAEAAGFHFLTVSDHYHPWTETQGQNPLVWSTIEPPSVNDVDPVALTIATLKLSDSHCANRHGEAKKDTAGQGEHALIDEHRLNDCEAQDHSEHHEEDNKQRPDHQVLIVW